MKIKASLVHRTFLFIESYALSKMDGEVEIDLADKSDLFKKVLVLSIIGGSVVSNVDYKDILETIKDNNLKLALKLSFGLIPATAFEDVQDAPVEVLEAVVEDIPVEDTADKFAYLESLLEGSNKDIARKLKEANLTDEEKAALIAKEAAGKDRNGIKILIKEI